MTNLDEICMLYDLMKSANVKTLLQIGFQGGSDLLCFDDLIKDGYIIVIAQKVPIEQLRDIDRNIKSTFTFIEADSNSLSAVESVSHLLIGTRYENNGVRKEVAGYGKPLDMLYIAGRHDGIAPMRDYLNFEPFVKPGGLIVWQDINYPNVARQYKEVIEDAGIEHDEFVSDTNHEIIANGIGIMRKRRA